MGGGGQGESKSPTKSGRAGVSGIRTAKGSAAPSSDASPTDTRSAVVPVKDFSVYALPGRFSLELTEVTVLK